MKRLLSFIFLFFFCSQPLLAQEKNSEQEQKKSEKTADKKPTAPEKTTEKSADKKSPEPETKKTESNAHIAPPIIFTPCTPTASLTLDGTPKLIEKSSNLRRKPGAAELADGKLMVIEGRVLNSECVPVENAVVTLWQRDANGIYPADFFKSEAEEVEQETADEEPKAEESKKEETKKEEPKTEEKKSEPPKKITPPKTLSTSEHPLGKPDRHFSYSGTAITDNTGRFRFLTVMPGSASPHAPNIHINVHHRAFKPLTTTFFFKDHPENKTDPTLKNLSPEQEKSLTLTSSPIDPSHPFDARNYSMVLTLEGRGRFKRF